jgi:hypothetical protein
MAARSRPRTHRIDSAPHHVARFLDRPDDDRLYGRARLAFEHDARPEAVASNHARMTITVMAPLAREGSTMP